MRILLAGDTHGNDRFFASICRAAKENDCDAVFQLGDFGYWEHYSEGKGYLKWCERQLVEKGLMGFWLDGNHENHPLLWKTYGPTAPGHTLDHHGFWRIREHLYYAPRGLSWVWDDVKFLALGGAYSVDKDYRVEGKSWWATEMITDSDVETAKKAGKVDVLLSHDAPVEVEIPSLRAQNKMLYPQSRNNRVMISEVVRATRPEFIFHGHYHDRYSSLLRLGHHELIVEGVGADMSPFSESFVIFDTKNYRALRG